MYPLIYAPSSTPASGWSAEQYRARLGPDLGWFGRGAVTTLATGFESERRVISSNFRSFATKPDHFDDLYLYVRNGDQAGVQRMLTSGEYEGPDGVFSVDYPYTDDNGTTLVRLALNTLFEISALPAQDYLGVSGMYTALNRGLETLPVVDLVSFTATADTIEYSLASYSWPVMGIGRVFAPRTDATSRRREISGATLTSNADTPVLVLPHAFAADDVFELEVLRPASTWIRVADTWADSEVGLVNESDEALYNPTQVARAALPFALDFMAQRAGRGTPEWQQFTGESREGRRTAALGRWFSSYRRSTAQRIGAR